MLKIDFHRDERKQETMHSANINGCIYAYFDIQYLQSKGRDKMLLINVNMIKSLFRFFSKPLRRFQSVITLTENINALCHWWHQDSIVTIPCLRTVSMVYQQRRRDREVDWFEVNRQDQSRSFEIQENGREEEEGGVRGGGGWNGGIEKWHLWSGDLTWGNTINH